MAQKKSHKITLSRKQGLSVILIVALVLAGIVAVSFFSFAGSCTQKNLKACPTIQKGSKGNAVKYAQTALNKVCYQMNTSNNQLTADGKFGNDTKSAVQGFQKSSGLSPDGTVGPKTWSRLDYWYNQAKANKEFDCFYKK